MVTCQIVQHMVWGVILTERVYHAKTARRPVLPAGWNSVWEKSLALDVWYQPEGGVLIGFSICQYGQYEFY